MSNKLSNRIYFGCLYISNKKITVISREMVIKASADTIKLDKMEMRN